MRNLKFRAWHKEVKKYYEVEAIDFMTEEIMYIYSDYYHEEQTKEWFDFKDIIIEQYTGLKDINGVEIYEGDIVKDIHTTYEVQHMGQLLDYGHFEVIGNIYEHQELIKESENE